MLTHISRMIKYALFVAMALAASPASAATVVTALGAQGVDHDLLEIPGDLFDLERESSYLAAVAVAIEPGRRERAWWWYAEGFLGNHTGAQRLVEAAASVGVAGHPFPVKAPWLEGRAGIGLSHAFGTPSYEDGPKDDPERRYRTQLTMTYDLTARPGSWNGWGVGLRIHHRSGGYGLVAPQRVGSNFIGLTLSRRFGAMPPR